MTTKITDLAAASALAGSDIVPCVVLSGPTTKKITVDGLFAARTFISFGSAPAAAGQVRLENAATISAMNQAGNADRVLLSLDTSNRATLGDTAGDYCRVTPAGGDGRLQISGEFLYNVGATQSHFFQVNGDTKWEVRGATCLAATLPIIGNAAKSSPYGVHGKTAISTTGSFSVADADMVFNHVRLTGGTAGTVTFPAPASDAAAYTKFVGNASLVTKTISTGAGATVALLTGTGAIIEFDSSVGCSLRAATVAYT